jgi:FeS assembly protein IscX
MEMVMAIDGFEETEEHCGERILEAIQMAWIEERD